MSMPLPRAARSTASVWVPARVSWIRSAAAGLYPLTAEAGMNFAGPMEGGAGRLNVVSMVALMLMLACLAGLALVIRHRTVCVPKAEEDHDAVDASWYSMVHVAPDAIFLIDVERALVIHDNELARRLCAVAERAGEDLCRRVVEGYAAVPQELVDDMDRRMFDISLPASPTRAARHLQASVVAVIANGRPALLCVLRDLTVRVAQELEQVRLRQTAEADVRAKSHFVAAMGHEIRTPLHGILGHLELLARSQLEGEQRARLRRITQSADSLLETINDMLDLASVEAGQLSVADTTFSPAAMLERVALLYAPLAQGKGLDFDINSALASSFMLCAPQARIEQVLRNLVSNAIKFTASGRVEIRMAWTFQERLRFEVADSGIGLADQQRGRLFEPFVQADATIGDRFGGTGLGLSLSRQLCRLMGGDIEVESTEGVGSVFSFEVIATTVPHPPDVPRLPGYPVIVLSRSANWRDQLARTLREAGAEVVAVPDPADLDHTGLPAGTPLVVFERNLAGMAVPAEFKGEVLRVRADGPLRARRDGGQWWVSCYAMEALVSVLVQLAPLAVADAIS